MDTMTTDSKRVRRNHSPALKAQILAECAAPGASVAKVAMSHGVNANVVHSWRRLARGQADASRTRSAADAGAFVALAFEAAAREAVDDRRIDIELHRGALSVRMAWPVSAAAQMTAWMRELLR
jgi:transposase